MKLALIGAAAVAAAALATPAMAQAVIEDPGYCAQFYPNGNCQYLEPGIPYTDRGFRRDENRKTFALPRGPILVFNLVDDHLAIFLVGFFS